MALPAVSSGIFGFPKELCAKIMLETISEFLKTENKTLTEVRLTNFDDPTVTIFR